MKKVIWFRRENKLEFIARTDGGIIPLSEPEKVFQFIENKYICYYVAVNLRNLRIFR